MFYGEEVLRALPRYRKLFRFPYLKEGSTPQQRDEMRAFLKARGYRNGHVTIDASDWYVDQRLRDRLKKDPRADRAPYRDFYLDHIRESNLEWLGRTRRDNLIAAEARIGEDVEIRRTVVGDRAHLANGSRLQDVVVFAGARVAAPGRVSQALVTPDGVYPIGQLTGKEGP